MKLMQHNLETGRYPGSTVIVDLDSESYDDLPLVSWMFLNEGQSAHGLWNGILSLTVLCEVKDAGNMLPHIYKQVHGWESLDKGALDSEKLGIETVTDGGTVFDFINQTFLRGKHIAQFNSTFRLTIHDWS